MPRRSRGIVAAAGGGDQEPLSGFELYEVQGDAAGALRAFAASSSSTTSTTSTTATSGGEGDDNPQQTLASKYNCALLSQIVKDSKQRGGDGAADDDADADGANHNDDNKIGGSGGSSGSSSHSVAGEILQHLHPIETEFRTIGAGQKDKTGQQQLQLLPARKRHRNELIMAYNRALVLQAAGENVACATICSDSIGDMITTSSSSAASSAAKQQAAASPPPEELAVVVSRIAFLLLECVLALSVACQPGSVDFAKRLGIAPVDDIMQFLESFDGEKDPQMKFLLALYKSRFDLCPALDTAGKVKSARKELKTAMEVLSTKLRSQFGSGHEAASVVSSANSEENSTQHEHHQQHHHHSHHHQQQQAPSTVILQKYNQSALNLKAHLEQLKGNTKKSLILCSEAQTVVAEDRSYEAVHTNNLAVVYETNNKRHLALHALAKGLRANKDPAVFQTDGTAGSFGNAVMILYNASICSLQTRNYPSAYECMATCVVRSDVFRNRPRCWLRMAEACLGIYSSIRHSGTNNISAIEVNGETKGVLLDSRLCSDTPAIMVEELVPDLASPDDLAQVKRNPLLRARNSLERALVDEEGLGHDALVSAQLSKAYVCLAFREYEEALKMATLVLGASEATAATTGPTTGAAEVALRLHKRRLASARLYAAEASCALGDNVNAMKFLVGDGQDDAFDRLASDLGGVTMEKAATNSKSKRRLARAQAMVRSSTSAASAAMNNLTAAKQLAMSAQAMEDAYATKREYSSARRAQIYCLLRRGEHGPALTLLRSLR